MPSTTEVSVVCGSPVSTWYCAYRDSLGEVGIFLGRFAGAGSPPLFCPLCPQGYGCSSKCLSVALACSSAADACSPSPNCSPCLELLSEAMCWDPCKDQRGPSPMLPAQVHPGTAWYSKGGCFSHRWPPSRFQPLRKGEMSKRERAY